MKICFSVVPAFKIFGTLVFGMNKYSYLIFSGILITNKYFFQILDQISFIFIVENGKNNKLAKKYQNLLNSVILVPEH